MSKTDTCLSASQAGLLRTDPHPVAALRDKLGEELRAMYEKLEQEPVPDHLLTLLWQLDRNCSGGKL